MEQEEEQAEEAEENADNADEGKEEIEDIAKEIVNKKVITKEKEVKEEQRFVPEGMVLPMETEADLGERDEAPRMKMPKFEGTISIDRKEIEQALKDDFDIPFKPGDDFDF